jgi:hypothetical protein
VARRKATAVRPVTRNIRLRLLKHDVDDDRFLQIFSNLASLIRRSERACEKAQNASDPDYAEVVAEFEADYLEEIIGASFVVLQTKIRRVQAAASELAAFMRSQYSIGVSGLDRTSVMRLRGPYRNSGSSLIALIWAVGNYYKHRDEWSAMVWKEPAPGEKEPGSLHQSRATRRMVQKAGIVRSSTGNMRAAYEFFGIDPYSNCERLADEVQAWAKAVYDEARRIIAVADVAS